VDLREALAVVALKKVALVDWTAAIIFESWNVSLEKLKRLRDGGRPRFWT